MHGPSPRKTPRKTPLSHQDSFSWLFGDPIANFSDSMPTKIEVIQRWMYAYDNIRGSSWKVSKEDKNLALKTMVSELIDNWNLQELKPDLSSPRALETLHTKVNRLINEAEKLQRMKKTIMEKNDLPKIEELRQPFLATFSFLPKGPVLKQVNDLEMVRFSIYFH